MADSYILIALASHPQETTWYLCTSKVLSIMESGSEKMKDVRRCLAYIFSVQLRLAGVRRTPPVPTCSVWWLMLRYRCTHTWNPLQDPCRYHEYSYLASTCLLVES